MRVRAFPLFALLLPAVLLAACVERAPSERGGDSTRRADTSGVDTLRRAVSDTLPAGRYQLRFHTRGLPDLFISLPPNYTVKDQGKQGGEDVILSSVDDPSLTSPSAVSPGYLRLRTAGRGDLSRLALPVATPDTAEIIVAGRPVRWMRASEANGSDIFHYARIESPDFFSALSPELAQSAPVLVLEVAGADSSRVAGLISAVQSIRFVP